MVRVGRRPILSLDAHQRPVRACAFSPDGRSILSAFDDGTLHRTALIIGDESARIDELANRVLWATPGVWRHLCLRTFDPDRNAYRLYPAEAYGPLPTCPRPRSSLRPTARA